MERASQTGGQGALRGPDVLYWSSATARDMADSGVIDVLETDNWSGEVIQRNGCGSVDFENGISLHFAREVHLAHLDTAATLRPCVSVKLFLEGSIAAEIDGLPLPMPQRQGPRGWVPAGAIVGNRDPVRFRRRARGGSHLVKVIVDLPHDWLATRLTPTELEGLADLLAADLLILPWQPGAEELTMARRLFALAARPEDGLVHVLMESAALGMVAGALQAVRGLARLEPGPASQSNAARLQQFRALVAALPEGPVDTAVIADGLGLSASTLQRLCQRGLGCSVQAFVRRERLAAARQALIDGQQNIARIAWRAGYASAANFTTAFGKAYGEPPSALRRAGGGAAQNPLLPITD